MAPISRLTGNKACILLEQLQEGAHTFQFTGINDLESTVQNFREKAIQEFQGYGLSEYLIFQHVPYNAFLQLSDNESSITFHYRSLYIHDSQILRLKMPTGRSHDLAAGEFAKMLSIKFAEMHVDNQVTAQASGRMEMRNISKQADGSWGPVGEDYVTCVLEVGDSEPVKQLVLDASIWLESEGSHVSQVVTINITREPHIIIQLWVLRTPLPTSPQPRSSRSDPRMQATKRAEVKVSLINDVPTASGCLRLSFEKNFERPPRPNTNEGDITFTTGDLTSIARQEWTRQNLI
jgi:hypothetical protein